MWNKDKRTISILLFIMIIGLIARLWSINYGLPEIKYIDSEKALGPAKVISYNILNGKFDIDPRKYQYPTVFINLMATEFVIYGLYYGLRYTHSGKYHTFKEAIQSLYTPPEAGYMYRAVPSAFHFMARVTSAIAGALTILFVFLLGTTAFKDKRIGLVAALFLALMFGHVKDSMYPMTDATMCLMGTIGAYYIAKISIDDRMKNYILAGAFIGLGISTKYFPVFFLIPFLIMILPKCLHDIKNKKIDFQAYKKPIIGLLMIPLFFFIGTPIFLARYDKVLGIGGKGSAKVGVMKEIRSQKRGKLGYTQCGYFDLLFSSFPINNEPLAAQSHVYALGAPILLLLICGLIYSLYSVTADKSRNRWLDIGFTVMVLLFYIIMAGDGKRKIIRYFYFLYPIYAVIAARFLSDSIDFLLRKIKRDTSLPVIVASLIFVLPTGIRTGRFNYLRSHTDVRLIAGRWFEQNIPLGSKVLMPQLYPPIISSSKYQVGLYMSTQEVEGFRPTIELVRRAGFEYVITSSYDTMQFYSPDAIIWNLDYALTWRNFYESLDKKAKLIKRFENNTFNKPGPEIKIFKIG